MKAFFVAALAAGLAMGTASAQSRDDEVAIAIEIVTMSGEVDAAMDAIMDMMPLIEGNIRSVYPDLTTRQYMQISEIYQSEFAGSRQEFETGIVEAYVETFSYDDLVGLHDFYRSDLGQRYAQALPALGQSAGDAGEMVGIRVDQRAAPRIRAIILGEESDNK